MNSKDITYYRNIHEIKLKKYIEDKLRNVENELGISLKNIEFVGWASSNSKKSDEIRIASNIHIKLDDGIYKVVICDSGKRANDGKVILKCKCDCGNYYYIRKDDIKCKNVISCGCHKNRKK